MEIHQLKASITDSDLNTLLKRQLPDDLPIEDVRVQVSAEGVQFRGMYPLFINVNFETLWEVSVVGGLVAAKLTEFKALGIPAGIFRSAIMKLLEDVVRKEDSLKLDGEAILIDVDRLVLKQGLQTKLNLRSVTCQPGVILIEAGA